jgi:hypothetical protein
MNEGMVPSTNPNIEFHRHILTSQMPYARLFLNLGAASTGQLSLLLEVPGNNPLKTRP